MGSDFLKNSKNVLPRKPSKLKYSKELETNYRWVCEYFLGAQGGGYK